MPASFSTFLAQAVENPALALSVLLTLGVLLVNGWTDAPNAIAGAVVTGALSFRRAVLLAAVCNFLGVLCVTSAYPSVAETVYSIASFGGGPEAASLALCAAMGAVVLWAAAAWRWGIPTSESHALIAGLSGAAIALHNGMSLRLLFEQLRDIRRDVRIPLILMGYLNPIMQFGFEAFCQKCVECGIDGVIIPDLPFRDYEESYKAIASKYDIRVIMLITPETSEARVREIDAHTDGFIYLVSSAATTGAQKDFDTRKQAYFKKIKDMNLRNPRMVGFGISNKQTFDAACTHSSGAIIGSRFVTLLNEKEGDAEKAIRQLKEEVRKL